jgi:cytoskeletal protein RodZ
VEEEEVEEEEEEEKKKKKKKKEEEQKKVWHSKLVKATVCAIVSALAVWTCVADVMRSDTAAAPPRLRPRQTRATGRRSPSRCCRSTATACRRTCMPPSRARALC